ncbi:PAS domain-containing protein [Oculatella sp. LEGE 06141]|uniref:sensor histidine kinase n=1 Tax=Oculatella sp. LEGE 06141 TaxID=1828648 RepID=UPI001882FEB6|nr:ATP-binding protein [Oculatella sp. LEGE 06141]MBE9181710.1 PAS domain-containing protein [Oculatella sp. LEGE 06141]
MDRLDEPITRLNETIAQLEQAMRQSQAEVKALKLAHEQERVYREQIESDLNSSRQLLQLVMDTLPEAIFWKDRDSVFLGCNRNFADDAGLASPKEIVGKTDYDLPWKQEETEFYRECDRRVMLTDKAELGIVEPQLNNEGRQTWLETNKVPLHDGNGKVIGILATYQDVTARKQAEIALQELNQKLQLQTLELSSALEQLQQSHLQLIQREKMSALGNLVAGVAHEINNPVGFLLGNLQPAQDYTRDLLELIDLYQKIYPDPEPELKDKVEAIDLKYIRDDMPKLLRSMHEGIRRIQSISISLRTFSRADTEFRVPFKINEGLDSTLLILKHRLKANMDRPAIEVIVNYQEMPPIRCFPGQLNQVFMNLLANAIDALEEGNQGKMFAEIQLQPNCISVVTELSACQQWVVIRIQDNGVGMTEDTQRKMFETAFTTKEVGKGTGLGLAIAHQIIVDKHGGTIEVSSTPGQGTEFVLRIPIYDSLTDDKPDCTSDSQRDWTLALQP